MQPGLHIVDFCRLPLILRREWWSADELRCHQERRLQALVQRAYDRVPYYRDLWDEAGVTPDAVRTVDDLQKLPVIDGRDFKCQPLEKLVARGTDMSHCIAVQTSGSTGQPLTVAYTHSDHFELVKAMSYRFYRANGVKLTDRILTLARNPASMTTRGWFQRLGLWRRTVLPAMDDPESWLGPAVHLQPDVITGLTVSLVELAQALAKRPGMRLRPRLVFTSGCRLEPADRDFLETTFVARVVDSYGGYESGFLAWQCPQCMDYHVNTDMVVLEVLKNGSPVRPGEPGEVVVTNLASSVMPFIRYPLGDVVTLSARSPVCGRSLPLISDIWGRSDDCVLLPSGRRVGPYPFYMLVLPMEWIREWQVQQRNDGSCLLAIVPRDSDCDADRRVRMQAGLTEILHGEVKAEVAFVHEIKRDLKTKWKSIVSELKDRQA